MLSESTVAHLNSLTYRPDAERKICWLPLSGIFWDDEMPNMRLLITGPEADRIQVLRMFGMRAHLWKGRPLSDEDQQLWDSTRAQVPDWAFFRHLEVSADDQSAQEQAHQDSAAILEYMMADADEVSITEKDGLQNYSVTYDLTKEQTVQKTDSSWWKQLLRPRRPKD